MTELLPLITAFDDDGMPIDLKRKGDDSSGEENQHLRKKKQKKNTTDEDNPSYPPEADEKVSKLVSNILVSIYFDVNYVSIIHNVIKWSPMPSTLTYYRLQYREGTTLLDKAVAKILHLVGDQYAEPREPTRLLSRLERFVNELGWKIFAICLLSEGFRRACRETVYGTIWSALIAKVKENSWSLEVYARSRNLDWRGLLLKFAHIGVPGLSNDLKPARKMWDKHPHHTVQDFGNKVKRARYEEKAQVHIDQSTFDPHKWDEMKEDPTLRKAQDGQCSLCFSKKNCRCTLDPWAGSLVELVQRPITGVGVRALTNFKKGDILGQFAGEICPPDYAEDKVYSLAQTAKGNPTIIATISPRQFGNWTRYIAHSCKASTWFFSRTVGDRTMVTVEAIRDIAAFEDITVDYGEGYWIGRECMCGEACCVSKDKTEGGSSTD